MGKKNKPVFNNSLFRTLLKDYKEADTNKILENKIDYIVDDFYRNKKSSKFSFFSFVPISAVVLIVCVLFSVFMIFRIKEARNLNQDIIITELNLDKSDVKITTNNTTINTVNKTRTKIQTDDAVVLVEKNTIIEINSGKKIFGSGQKKINNKYKMKKGEIFADVSSEKSAGKFTIETSFGNVKTSGAKFSVKTEYDELIIKCYEGKVEFISTQKEMKAVILEENFQIVLEEKDNKIEIKKIILEPEKEKFPELKRDKYKKSFNKNDDIKYIDIEVVNKEAEIFINNSFLDNGKVRYICKNKDKIEIVIKLDGYKEIKDSITVVESKKLSYSLAKLDPENIDEDKADDKKVIDKIWETKIYNLNEMIFFKNYTSVVTEKTILILNDNNGSIIKTLNKEKTHSGFTSYNNLMLFHEAPDKIKLVNIPQNKTVFENKAGPIAFGKPFIDGSHIIIASTNHNLYIYDYTKNKEVEETAFDSGFYCTPVKSGDKIILSNLSKKLIVYSIDKKSIIWEKNHDNRFITDQPVVNKNLFAVTDEKSMTYVYNIDNGDLKFTINSDKKFKPVFSGNNLFVFNKYKLKKYNMNGKLNKEIILNNSFIGFFIYNNYVYVINKKAVEVYDNNLKKKSDISVDEVKMFENNKNNVYLLHGDKKLVKYKILKEN